MNKEEILENMKNKAGFFKHNNMQIVDLEKAILKTEISNNSLNVYGIAHGGLIFGLGDNAMGLLLAATKKKGVTLSSTINYLYPGKGKWLIAKPEIIKAGKTTAVLKANIYDEEDHLVAIMNGTYYYID